MINRYRWKLLIVNFCLFVLILTTLPVRVFADASETKTVRVGYVNVKGYEEGGEGEYKTGF